MAYLINDLREYQARQTMIEASRQQLRNAELREQKLIAYEEQPILFYMLHPLNNP